MDFEVIIPSAAISAVLVYGFLHVEAYFRRRALIKRGPKPDSIIAPEIKAVSRTLNSAEGIVCGCPRHIGNFKMKNYILYSDGDAWCLLCDEIEEDE